MTGGFDTFAFTISSGTPTVGNSYTVNDATYRVLSVVSSVAKAERTAGTKEPPTSGTLAGSPTLTYSAVANSSSFGNLSFYRVEESQTLLVQ